jgi:protein-S-isoprenylcysteine O-methyltransferase
MADVAMAYINRLQSALNFGGCTNPEFVENGIGKIGTAGFFLGLVGGIHYGISLMGFITYLVSGWFPFGIYIWCTYVGLLCTFHFLEFFITAVKQPFNLSYDSYIINHGTSYTIAALTGFTEYWVEYFLFGNSKFWTIMWCPGLFVMVMGQVVRSIAMWQCGENFAHTIMDNNNNHKLVKDGIYSVLRHPSYFGWFYWSIGSQLLLCNPISTVVFALAAWRFFSTRIPYEEDLLVKFYRSEYIAYAKDTIVGIPFMKISPTVQQAIDEATESRAKSG